MVEVYNETNKDIDIKSLKETIAYAINYEKIKNVSFNVIIVDNEKIHKMNKEHRNIDKPTDVITFALQDKKDDERFIKKFGLILGDIYISIDKVKTQAISYGHSEKRELNFLLVHGFLHLLGYDHMNKEDEKIMFERQEEILNGKGITR